MRFAIETGQPDDGAWAEEIAAASQVVQTE